MHRALRYGQFTELFGEVKRVDRDRLASSITDGSEEG